MNPFKVLSYMIRTAMGIGNPPVKADPILTREDIDAAMRELMGGIYRLPDHEGEALEGEGP